MEYNYNKNEKVAYEKGYRVTKEGVVIGKRKNPVGWVHTNGYRRFKIRDHEGKNLNVGVHRLQAYQKYGEEIYTKGYMVRHLDNDCTNNHYDNIEIGTASQNAFDVEAERRKQRALHASSFIKKHHHDEVRRYHEKHGSYKKTMEHFNISSKGTLSYILNKQS